MNKLKPCRFCGSEAKYYNECDMVKVVCSNYDCQDKRIKWFDEPEDAVADWNRRPAPHKYTLEELEELEGQPIWLETGWISINEQIIGEYEILRSITDEGFWFTRNVKGFKASDYGETWVAYDRPPEEESND